MDNIISKIRTLSEELLPHTIEMRRALHSAPELSFREKNTSAYVREKLLSYGIVDIRSVAGTGVLAHIKGRKESGSRIVLRAELDALPVSEKTGSEFASRNEGIMHACGHDAHMAMLLASARILNSIRDNLHGDIWFLFQPGEELVPGGASLVMKEGVLQEINPTAIIAHHVLPELEPGHTGFRAGKYMASSDEIYISVKGKGGHAALPGESTDQVLRAAQLITELKRVVEQVSQGEMVVFSIGKIVSGGATNVIPETVSMEGTLRTVNETLREEIHRTISRIAKELSGDGISVEIEIRKGYPVLENNKELTDRALEIAGEINGRETVHSLDLRMSSEDFAFYSVEFPVLFYRLGVSTGRKPLPNLHSPYFEINEAAMDTGVRTICSITYTLGRD